MTASYIDGVPDQEDHQGGDDKEDDQDEDAHDVFLVNFCYFSQNYSSGLFSQSENCFSEHVHDSDSVDIIAEHIL